MSIRKRVCITAATGILMIMILSYGFYTGHRMNAVYAPLIDATMEIKYESSLAHLRVEEVISGVHDDEEINFVFEHLDKAEWYARAILNGGTNAEGTFIPVNNTGMREAIKRVIYDLTNFRKYFIKFMNNNTEAEISEVRLHYHDDFFKSLGVKADEAEGILQNIMRDEMQGFMRTQFLLIGLTILLFIITGKISFLYERKLKSLIKELEELSHTDELTGLYNRRGFFTLADHLLKAATRNKQGLYMLYADLDNLKDINDTRGHDNGDIALIEIANILKKCYRESDIVARIGGDEFVIIPVGTKGDNIDMITARLQNALNIHNANSKNRFMLSVSVGIVYYDPEKPCTVDELLAQADRLMYIDKKQKKETIVREEVSI